jgi:hypothetical protein
LSHRVIQGIRFAFLVCSLSRSQKELEAALEQFAAIAEDLKR